MTKVYILHENDDWTQHLTKQMDALNVPYECWHLSEGSIDLSNLPPKGVFYNRMSASSHTRGHRFAPELTNAILEWLERHDRTVINGTRAMQLEVSKAAQYMELEKHGIITPKTIIASGKEQIVNAADQFADQPFITKHNRAGKGLGVQLFQSKNALESYIHSEAFEEPVDGITLLQQYISSPDSSITRCEFVGGSFLYAVKVDTSNGFELCPADACQISDQFCPSDSSNQGEPKPGFEIVDGIDPTLISKYEQMLKSNNIGIAGIEFIQDSNGYTYTYDINTNTNYNSDAEARAGIYGMLEVAKYLQQKLTLGISR
ncbi:ATP-grasp domain-containing protein [Texcoconibacillus texcoconensis]|uniref:ATP-grasp domain-containing protein n=1 Tax=Texcoconibacillus texcoconensis TaxID=1095777 RepID=A0A840QLR5_9BACI|nr:alpha-L-glutamate ligase [Texcoconibacillus texcoconensis]MBB5172296.1 hypothetical protein [Texcoconibacillus texcoconensis]